MLVENSIVSRSPARVGRRATVQRNFRMAIWALPFALGELGGCAYVIVPEGASESAGGAASAAGGAVSDSGGAASNGGSAVVPSGGSGSSTGGRVGAGMGGRFGAGMGGRVGGGTGGAGTGGGVAVDPTCTCAQTWVVSTNITPPLTPGDCIGYMGTLYEYDPEMPNQLQWADPACTPPTSGSQNCMYHARLTSRGPCP